MIDAMVLSGLNILIVGLGREGLALANFLADRGLAVTATDLRSAETLKNEVSPLEALGVGLVLGDHPSSLLDQADILFVSPGVPLESPFLEQARQAGLPLCTESKLFCYLCPAPITAITGSSGKTTTTTLVGKILEAEGLKTWVGGNIGQPLIGVVDQIGPEDRVVLELSSFQLEYFHARLNTHVDMTTLPAANRDELAKLLGNWSPPVSAILNITPNHLDRHPSMKHYVKAKRAIIDYQGKTGAIVMGLDNDMTRAIGSQFGAKVRWFSLEAHIAGGAGLIDDKLVFFDEALSPQLLAQKQNVKLRGNHNLSNILAACLLARESGASIDAMQQVITTFAGVDHRLELVREYEQVAYYNDSVSTSPERLIAGLQAFDEPLILLAGGRDKHLPWEEAAWLILSKVHDLILFGEAAGLIAEAVEHVKQQNPSSQTTIHHCDTLDEAVKLAAKIAKPPDVVLLSPGCTSFDAFKDFAARGQRFRELVLGL